MDRDVFVKGRVDLSFDPSNSETDETIRAIFLDDMTRNIWLGIAQKHTRNQYFNKSCIDTAWEIKNNGFPTSPERLQDILNKNFGAPEYDPKLSEQLFPYLIASKNIEYTVTNNS